MVAEPPSPMDRDNGKDGTASATNSKKRGWSIVGRKMIRVRKAVMHDVHQDNPKHQEHVYHEHAEVSSEELFFDLVFVGIGIELGHFLKSGLTGQRLAETLAIFMTSWLTWFHTNILLTRFDIRRPFSWLLFVVMLATLGHAIHAIDESPTGLISGFGLNDGVIFGSLSLCRLCFIITYGAVCWKIKLARPMISKYIMIFALSALLMLVAAVVPSRSAAIATWCAALFLELIMYPIALLTPHEYQLTVGTAHILERNQLWAVLILGESIIGIITAPHTRSVEYYTVVVLAFLCVYWLMIYYNKTQHLIDEKAEEHAIDHSPILAFMFDALQLIITSAMLVFAVGLKTSIQYAGFGGKYKQLYAWVLTGSLGVTMFALNTSSLLHKMRPLLFCGKPTGRLLILTGQAILSMAIIPLALFVHPKPGDALYHADDPTSTVIPTPSVSTTVPGTTDMMTTSAIETTPYYNDTSNDYTGLGPEHLMPILTVALGVLLFIEYLIKAVDDEELEDVLEEEDYFRSEGTQTELVSLMPLLPRHASNGSLGSNQSSVHVPMKHFTETRHHRHFLSFLHRRHHHSSHDTLNASTQSVNQPMQATVHDSPSARHRVGDIRTVSSTSALTALRKADGEHQQQRRRTEFASIAEQGGGESHTSLDSDGDMEGGLQLTLGSSTRQSRSTGTDTQDRDAEPDRAHQRRRPQHVRASSTGTSGLSAHVGTAESIVESPAHIPLSVSAAELSSLAERRGVQSGRRSADVMTSSNWSNPSLQGMLAAAEEQAEHEQSGRHPHSRSHHRLSLRKTWSSLFHSEHFHQSVVDSPVTETQFQLLTDEQIEQLSRLSPEPTSKSRRGEQSTQVLDIDSAGELDTDTHTKTPQTNSTTATTIDFSHAQPPAPPQTQAQALEQSPLPRSGTTPLSDLSLSSQSHHLLLSTSSSISEV
eukprot:m.21646 g.21646  ORF g.21646 m.21646 type:complete len:933 (-) comp8310_c0_seq1:632-3430(-)